MTLQRVTAKNISAAERLDGFIDAYTPTVASIARGALARLRKQVPGAIELVGDRYTGLVIGFSPTERPADATLSIILYPRWVNLFFLRGAILHDPEKTASRIGHRGAAHRDPRSGAARRCRGASARGPGARAGRHQLSATVADHHKIHICQAASEASGTGEVGANVR